MTTEILSTQAFFQAMRDPKFIRLDPHHGKIENRILYTEIPPEFLEGFEERLVSQIATDLNLYDFTRRETRG